MIQSPSPSVKIEIMGGKVCRQKIAGLSQQTFTFHLLEVEDLGLWQFVLETGLDPEMKAEIAAELGNLVHTYVRPPVSGLLEEVQIRHHLPFLQVFAGFCRFLQVF